MQTSARLSLWDRIYAVRRVKLLRVIGTLGLAVLGPALVILTFLALGPFALGSTSTWLRVIILADIVYVLMLAALVGSKVLRVFAAQRAQRSGSRLHLRLSAIFAMVALFPTVMVAIFAVLTINIGLEGWFSDRVRSVVHASSEAAQAYEYEQSHDLRLDAESIAAKISLAHQAAFILNDGDLRQMLTKEHAQLQRGLREAFVIDGAGEIRARGERSYLFDFDKPSPEDLRRAANGETVLIQDWESNEFRALLSIIAYPDRFLYVSREVDGKILQLLDDTRESVRVYSQLEADRGRQLLEFGLLYFGFALILILATTWIGLWIAERLARPVGELAAAVKRVGQGDFDVRVPPLGTRDEIATLSHSFNRMTRELKSQREALTRGHLATEAQRRLFDSVLSSVTAGVIGLDHAGQIDFLNRSARRMLDLLPDEDIGQPIVAILPEFSGLLERAHQSDSPAQGDIRLTRKGKTENLLVRIAPRSGQNGEREGYVVAFDDVTDLVSAQRMAAWGDVARRIAHEIKNPLTPIQLSAERIRRRFGPRLAEEDSLALEQMVDVIVRQTGDLRRIVDEFSKFARMPEPHAREEDLVKLVRDAVLLQESGQPDVIFELDLPQEPILVDVDATMIGQALTNLLKNGGEATESLRELGAPPDYQPRLITRLNLEKDHVLISISDNGIGLPEDRSRLFEPYMTTRQKGTGLGLPIVKKIIEEHGGSLSLTPSEVFGGSDRPGALADIRLPRRPLSAPRRQAQD